MSKARGRQFRLVIRDLQDDADATRLARMLKAMRRMYLYAVEEIEPILNSETTANGTSKEKAATQASTTNTGVPGSRVRDDANGAGNAGLFGCGRESG